MIERIKKIINFYDLSVNAFANKIGANQVTINQQINGDRKISLETITKIINSFDLISPDWLLTGKGEMLKKDPNNGINISGTSYGIVGGNNSGSYNIGNSYNFALPEKGHVKIIRPDGTVSTESYNSDIENRLAELEALREKIVVLDKLVKSQEEQIELYKMKIDMLEHRQ